MHQFVKNFKFRGYSRNYLLLMEPEYSLPCLQEPASGLWSEQQESRNSEDGL